MGEEMRVQGIVQLNCGHVDIDRMMIIQIKDFLRGVGVKWGAG